MTSVGERIKLERESRNTTLDDMAVATGIGHSYLESLEKGEYHELPGPAFGKLYIRAYAEVLGFDPQPWIDDYDREHRLLMGASADSGAPARVGARPMAEAIARWRQSKLADDEAESEPELAPEPEPELELEASEVAAPVVATDAAPEPVPEPVPVIAAREATAPPVVIAPPEPVPANRRPIAMFLLAGAVVVAAAAIYVGTRGTGGEHSTPPTSVPPAASSPSLAPAPPPPSVTEIPKPALPKAAVPQATTPPAELTVTEFGVGRRIVNLTLEGESDHFAEGDRVAFASRVLGGSRGGVIRHVWLYEGRVQQTITLRVGGPDWRTHTNKTLGHAGEWAVEARDDKGRVLARTAFTCEPRPR